MPSKKRRKRALPLEQGGTQRNKRIRIGYTPTKKQMAQAVKNTIKNRLYQAKAEISQNIKNYRAATSRNKQLKIEIPKGYMKAWNLAGKKNINTARDARNLIKEYIRNTTKITGEWLYNMGYEPTGSDDFFVQLFIEDDRYYDGYTLSELYQALRQIGGQGTTAFYNYTKNLFDNELRKALNK